jgi:hypothetical protein
MPLLIRHLNFGPSKHGLVYTDLSFLIPRVALFLAASGFVFAQRDFRPAEKIRKPASPVFPISSMKAPGSLTLYPRRRRCGSAWITREKYAFPMVS